MSTLYEQLHNSATHANGFDPSCPVCVNKARLMLIHAAEHIQTTTRSFTHLTPENKGRQETAAFLRRQSRSL